MREREGGRRDLSVHDRMFRLDRQEKCERSIEEDRRHCHGPLANNDGNDRNSSADETEARRRRSTGKEKRE